MAMANVYDLRSETPLPVASYSCEPRSAVIAAYAQSRGDWNTWNYERAYSHLVREGEHSFICGDFACAK